MYEGYLQHDAQEVLQCILGYIQEACDTIRKEQEDDEVTAVKFENAAAESTAPAEDDGQVSGKRKSDTEVGNAKKKPKSVKTKKSHDEVERATRNKSLTRSKRKSSSDLTMENTEEKEGKKEEETKDGEKEGETEGKAEKSFKDAGGNRKKRTKLGWLRPSGKQPSIFSKFCSVGKITSTIMKTKPEQEGDQRQEDDNDHKSSSPNPDEDKKTPKHQGTKTFTCIGRQVLFIQSLPAPNVYTPQKGKRGGTADISVPVVFSGPGPDGAPVPGSAGPPDPLSGV